MKNIGLYDKYTISVTHKDGKEVDPNKEFIVIELTDPDPREFEAALQFARFCISTGYKQLGEDIMRKLYKDIDCVSYVDFDDLEDYGPYPVAIAERLVTEMDQNDVFAVMYIDDDKFNIEDELIRKIY